jgi:hypothetical protein
MEDEDPLDPQIILERRVDELFERSDARVHFILNQVVERVRDTYEQQSEPQPTPPTPPQ